MPFLERPLAPPFLGLGLVVGFTKLIWVLPTAVQVLRRKWSPPHSTEIHPELGGVQLDLTIPSSK